MSEDTTWYNLSWEKLEESEDIMNAFLFFLVEVTTDNHKLKLNISKTLQDWKSLALNHHLHYTTL